MNVPEPQVLTIPAMAAEIKEDWIRGQTPDAAAVLAEHPELLADKSVVLDLAYEEYCLRAEAGDAPEPDDFCTKFPAHRSSLRRLITAHQLLELNSSLLGSSTPAHWPRAGQLWGDFLLLRELGRGAFARVYLATEQSTGGRAVAVKLSFAGDSEARTLGRLNHPNIVPVLSARADDATGLTAICMPFLGGATLTDVVDLAFSREKARLPRKAALILDAINAAAHADDPPLESTLPNRLLTRGTYEEGVALLGLRLAEALAFLHERDIYHLDLKPSNVLLGSDGQPLLLDFNLSTDARNGSARQGGTLPYIAPEQIEALTAESGAAPIAAGRADLYSLGAILYELLTGEPPFDITKPRPLRELAPELLEKRRSGYRPIRSVQPRVARGLANVIDRCLAFAPAQRPPSAESVAASLRRFLATRKRSRWLTRILGGALLASVLCAAGTAAIPRAPGYAERGRTAYARGDFQEAVRCFEEALVLKPNEPRARWPLAFSRLRLSEQCSRDEARNQVRLALEEFSATDRSLRNPEIQANRGYCLSRLGEHAEAIFEYRQAEERGLHSAALYNDRAYSHLSRDELDAADGDLAAAIECDPNLAAAYQNRARLALMRWQRGGDLSAALSGQTDAAKARTLGLTSAELLMDSARLTLASRTQGSVESAIQYIQSALNSGQNPALLSQDVLLTRYLGDNEVFQELTKRPGPGAGRLVNTRLVMPVTSLIE
jgi:serine/threonine protein kinase/Flp pilus assembly protein TadD